MKLSNIQPGDTLIWRHCHADDLKEIAKSPRQLERTITVQSIHDDHVKTNYGNYSLNDGRNMMPPCGCNRYCSCYGIVDKPAKK